MVTTVLVIEDSTGLSSQHSTVPPFEFTGKSPWTSCEIAQQLLEERDGAGSWEFINKSIGGTGWGDWLNGREADPVKNLPWMPPFAKTLDNYPQAGLIYVELGINNALDPNGTLTGVEFAITKMLETCNAKGRRLILATPNPINIDGRPEVNTRLEQIRNVILRKGQDFGLSVIDHWGVAVALPRHTWPKLLADRIHPRDDYYRFKGQTQYMGFAYL